ncbi:hypothetical protein SAMN02746009_03456, partial [Hymenobacter psychrotolerans DSM 18569]
MREGADRRKWQLWIFFALGLLLAGSLPVAAQTSAPINRQAVVERHKVVNTTTDMLSSVSVGNGAFAYTVDVTGLQTFPTYYEKGVPLGMQSEWGWHSFPNTKGYTFEQSLRDYDLNGRKISYSVQRKEPANKEAVDFLRANPHRLQLGNLGFVLLKKNGQPATIQDLRDVRQELNPWTGEIKSHFSLEGTAVDVVTVEHQQQDVVAARVESELLKSGRVKVALRFPWPTAGWADMGTDYSHAEAHKSGIVQKKKVGALIMHQLDTTKYYLTQVAEKVGAKKSLFRTGKTRFEVFDPFKPPSYDRTDRGNVLLHRRFSAR